MCYVPRRSILCDQVLNEDSAVRAAVARVTEFPLYLIPFDDDVLSMEAIADMRTTRVDGSPAEIFNAAHALMKLQTAYGTIPHIYGKGHYAKQLCDMLQRMRSEAAFDTGSEGAGMALQQEEDVPPEIGNLLIVDREVDMITPMLTQLSFEGAVDEVFGTSSWTQRSSRRRRRRARRGARRRPRGSFRRGRSLRTRSTRTTPCTRSCAT